MMSPARELLMLGMLRRSPRSAYDINVAIKDHSPLYRHLATGNVYYILDALTEKGFLTRHDVKAARGPAKTKAVLRLSAIGESRFQELLASVIRDAQGPDPAFETAIVLLGQISRAKAIDLINERRAELVRQEHRVKRLFGDLKSRSGPGVMANMHALERLKCEQAYAQAILQLLRNRRWHPEWEDTGLSG